MSYKSEMLELAQELRSKAFGESVIANSPEEEKLRRQAEVLEFLVTHPEQIVDIFKEQEEAEGSAVDSPKFPVP